MDIGAYVQIDDLSEIARNNGINVPRLRGYRLMANENPILDSTIDELVANYIGMVYADAVRSVPRFCEDACGHEYSSATRKLERKYLIKDEAGIVVGFRWDKLHGKNKKRLKLAVKHAERNVRRQVETFNKYVGRNDVLYIHARIGGNNFSVFGGAELSREPWFIEKVDDYHDNTYCDIYAKIQPVLTEDESKEC